TRSERVTDAADGPEVVVPVERAQLRSQPADVDVHGPAVAPEVEGPDAGQQLVAGEDAARMGGEVRQQLELLGGEAQRLPCEGRPGPGQGDRHSGASYLSWPVALLCVRPPLAAEHRLDPCQQLGPAEGLGDVVIGPD